MSLGKASIKRAASADARKSTAKTAESGAAEAVISPVDAEEIQVKFLTGKTPDAKENQNRPVHITEAMPDYLL